VAELHTVSEVNNKIRRNFPILNRKMDLIKVHVSIHVKNVVKLDCQRWSHLQH
jgi:hypothetical protein